MGSCVSFTTPPVSTVPSPPSLPSAQQQRLYVPPFIARNLKVESLATSNLPLTIDGWTVNEKSMYFEMWALFMARPVFTSMPEQKDFVLTEDKKLDILSEYQQQHVIPTNRKLFDVVTSSNPVAMMSTRCAGYDSSPLQNYISENQNYGPLLRQGCIQLHLLYVVVPEERRTPVGVTYSLCLATPHFKSISSMRSKIPETHLDGCLNLSTRSTHRPMPPHLPPQRRYPMLCSPTSLRRSTAGRSVQILLGFFSSGVKRKQKTDKKTEMKWTKRGGSVVVFF